MRVPAKHKPRRFESDSGFQFGNVASGDAAELSTPPGGFDSHRYRQTMSLELSGVSDRLLTDYR